MLPGVTHKDSELIPSIMRQLWVFLAYVAAARLALFLALPPGYASPIWPAAGLAMAACILWGPSLTVAIFLGSLATNLRPDELMQNPMEQILLQLCLALGTSIQAYLGSVIYRLVERRWPQQTSARRLSWEIFLLGPVTCISAATIAVSSLSVFHIIEMRMFTSNWISWWLGDSFGAGVLCPLLIRFHRSLEYPQMRRKASTCLLLPVSFSILLVGALTLHLKANDRRNQSALEHGVHDFHARIQDEVNRVIQNLGILAAWSQSMEPRRALEHFPLEREGIQILWVPRIPVEQRVAFETSHSHDQQHFTVLEKTSSGHLAPASERSVYWPLVSKTGPELNLLPVAFDLGSLPGMKSILQTAWTSSTALTSPLLSLDQDKKSVLIIQKSPNQNTGAFQQGLYVGLITWDALIQRAIVPMIHPIFKVQIQTSTQDLSFERWFGLTAAESSTIRLHGQFQKALHIGPQTFTLQVDFPAAAFHGGRMGDPMFVALLCMLLAFVVNVLLVSQQNVGFMLQAQPKGQQDELQFHYEALRDADHHKTQVLAHMSHQIKSPLQGMLGLLDMLRGTGLDAKQRSSVDTIIANCQSMRLMLDDIHTYAKLEAGQLTLATEEFLIDECLRDLSSVYEIAAEEQQNEFSTQIELPARLRVQGDRRRIHRVLSHLLSESIYRTQKGRIRFQASLLPDGSLCFTVESQRGPLDSVHDHEWEFGNTKNWPSLEIFNLKTCQRIVQAMGGRLSMERSGPKANLVTIILPLPTLQPQEASPSVHDSQFQNVLVVDDNAINLSVASGLLIKLGYQVETAANGLQALEKVKQKRYDVIFMDCQMPIMDGYETTRQIRAYSQPEHGPLIIALTANSLSETYEKAIHSGMDRVITKPVSLDILIQTIGYAKAGPGASLTQNPSIMDFKAFYLGLGDDSDLIQTAVTRFFEEIDGVMDRLRDQVEKKDASSLARTAHTLKGMAALFAAHTLVEANRSLEMAGKEERIHEFAALHKRVVTLTELLKMELKHLMDDRNLTGKDVA